MGFTKRKKQPDAFRSNPCPTAEQILTGVAVDVTEKMIEKASNYIAGKIHGRDDSTVAKKEPSKKKAKKSTKVKE